MKGYARYRGRKPGHTIRTIWRAVCGVGLLLTFCAAGHSDEGAPMSVVMPMLLIGMVMFAAGGYFGELFE